MFVSTLPQYQIFGKINLEFVQSCLKSVPVESPDLEKAKTLEALFDQDN